MKGVSFNCAELAQMIFSPMINFSAASFTALEEDQNSLLTTQEAAMIACSITHAGLGAPPTFSTPHYRLRMRIIINSAIATRPGETTATARRMLKMIKVSVSSISISVSVSVTACNKTIATLLT